MKKISEFLSKNFLFLEVKISTYLNRRVFVMYIMRYIRYFSELHNFLIKGSLKCTISKKGLLRSDDFLRVLYNHPVWLSVRPWSLSENHYENTPIQIYRKCHLQKLKIFT